MLYAVFELNQAHDALLFLVDLGCSGEPSVHEGTKTTLQKGHGVYEVILIALSYKITEHERNPYCDKVTV